MHIEILPKSLDIVLHDSAKVAACRLGLPVMEKILRQFFGKALNISVNGAGQIVLLQTTRGNLLMDHHFPRQPAPLQLHLGPKDGMIFNLVYAKWEKKGDGYLFGFRAVLDRSADITDQAQVILTPAQVRNVLANTRAYLNQEIPDRFKTGDQIFIRVELTGGTILTGRINVTG